MIPMFPSLILENSRPGKIVNVTQLSLHKFHVPMVYSKAHRVHGVLYTESGPKRFVPPAKAGYKSHR